MHHELYSQDTMERGWGQCLLNRRPQTPNLEIQSATPKPHTPGCLEQVSPCTDDRSFYDPDQSVTSDGDSSVLLVDWYMSYSLNALKVILLGIIMGGIQGDTRSVDYGSYEVGRITEEHW